MKDKTYPWVFWINISVRKQWFSYLWKTRGANFLELQVWIFKISIGLPWKKRYIDSNLRDYSSMRYIKHTNSINRNKGILIGKY